MQKVPVWSTMCSQPMVQGRIAFEAMDVPVAVGGVQVRPGDVVVADGDGVIVVPSEIAEDVGRYAHEEHEREVSRRAASGILRQERMIHTWSFGTEVPSGSGSSPDRLQPGERFGPYELLALLGEGSFAPRQVTTGHEGGGAVEILEGLNEGDRIVTSSQFLIDSESSLQAAVQKMIAQRSTPEGD